MFSARTQCGDLLRRVWPCQSRSPWPHSPALCASFRLTVPFCLADCLLHEENFSVRCPKHKVSQSPREPVLPAGGGKGGHWRTEATLPGLALPGSWPWEGREAQCEREACSVGCGSPGGVGGWRSVLERIVCLEELDQAQQSRFHFSLTEPRSQVGVRRGRL